MNKEPNLHDIDRIVRLIVGIGGIYLGFIDTSLISNQMVSVLVGIFGVANMVAFATRRCPVYTIVGFSTASKTSPPAKA